MVGYSSSSVAMVEKPRQSEMFWPKTVPLCRSTRPVVILLILVVQVVVAVVVQ